MIRVNLERVAITICALLVPEYIIGWAVRQRLVARQIAKTNAELAITARQEYAATLNDSAIALSSDRRVLFESVMMAAHREEEKRRATSEAERAGGVKLIWHKFRNKYFPDDDDEWTVTHGFFVVMGGFYFLEPGNDPCPLSPEEVEERVKKGSLELPKKSEINDKSKGDAFSKAVASLQTIWFVMQSIARPIQHLPLTELEVVTLAYTAIHIAMLYFWWSKPLSVSRPVRVLGQHTSTAKDCEATRINEPTKTIRFVDPLASLLKAVMGAQDDEVDLSKLQSVPTFYAGKPDDMQILWADAIALVFAMVFGAVHCAAWSFAFPTHSEKLIWRIASVALVGVPAIYIALIILYAFELKRLVKHFLLLSLVGIPFYIAARIALFVLAFTTLRSLSPEALETVHWTTIIPHF
ncbi:hypothetical protein HWV62_21988 [Athelia sp. TMB]|nr:hypothetical protein HWV62_21988 [Athelia sp. TMB]